MAGSSQRWWWWCLTASLVVGCVPQDGGDDGEVDSTGKLSAMVCGFEVEPSPQTIPESACDVGRTVLGPARVVREAGPPQTETFSFETSGNGDACVTIRNEGLAAAWVSIDGDSTAGPDAFNPNVDEIQSEVPLAAGSHELQVKTASRPGASLLVEVREPYATLDVPNSKVGPNGALEITRVATDHPLLTPNGDGHHDETAFNVDGEPLVPLPGNDDGTVDYFLDWEVFVYDLESCAVESTDISGRTEVNSPTNVRTSWDGTDASGTTLDSGTYAYYVEVSLVRDDGFVLDTVTSDRYGMTIDSSPVVYDERPSLGGQCDPLLDPYACRCPGGGGIGGMDPNCSFGDAHPNHGTLESLDDPTTADLSFITTTQDPDTGRYQVVADMREFNDGGLVLQGAGQWGTEAELRQWVSDLTGVPVGAGDSLFNFDYVQIGTSTAVTEQNGVAYTFNHLLLDAMTNASGAIEVDGVVTNVGALLNDTSTAPASFQVDAERADDECTNNGSTNGASNLSAKFCAFNEAIRISDGDLGVYLLRTSVFDVVADGEATTLDELCIANGVFSCGYRTFAVPADSIEVESSFYVETDEGPKFAFEDAVQVSDATAASVSINRQLTGGDTADGVCSRSVVTNDGLRVRLDSADGAVPGTCIANGVFF